MGLPPVLLLSLGRRLKLGPGENNQLWTKGADRQGGKMRGVAKCGLWGGVLTKVIEATKEMEEERVGGAEARGR